MTKRNSGLLRIRRPISFLLCMGFVLYSLFVINFRLFIDTPAFNKDRVFIGNAKSYFFEGSDLLDKELEFGNACYKSLWLSLPNVSEVTTLDATSPADYLIGSMITYITIDNQKITMSTDDKSGHQLILLEEALNQVSAAAWNEELNNFIHSFLIWICFGAALVGWFIFSRKIEI